MNWWRFLVWNVAGAIAWAAGYGLLAYWAGRAVVDAVSSYSAYAVVVIALVGIVAFYVHRRWIRRLER